MITKTLTTLVQTTAQVTGVKPVALTADRIGLGLRLVVVAKPAEGLSRYPDSDPNPGPRSKAERMREHPPAAAAAPAGPAGRPAPGSTASRRSGSLSRDIPFTGWRGLSTRRASSAAVSGHTLGHGDCQSPARGFGRRPATRSLRPAGAAAK